MWILQCLFTRHPLVTLFRVTSELAMQLILYQYDISLNGDEWVTSETKWITAVTHWHIKPYSTMGDELTSSVKILFLRLILLCLYCKSQVIPMWFPCKSHFSPILGNGLTTDLKRTWNGGRRYSEGWARVGRRWCLKVKNWLGKRGYLEERTRLILTWFWHETMNW